jgi:hypothetical protein
MNEMNAAVDKLKSIQQLWRELGRTESEAPEYETLMKKIRTLSAEYQALLDASKKPAKSKSVATEQL